MTYTKEQQDKCNIDGIEANRQVVEQIRVAIRNGRCGFVVCETCPFNRERGNKVFSGNFCMLVVLSNFVDGKIEQTEQSMIDEVL